MEKNNMSLCKDWDALNNGQKGDWYFMESDKYLVLRFGDTMDDVVVLPIQDTETFKAWSWNGNKEFPTITPSILIKGSNNEPNKWHDFLTDGKLIEV